MVMITGLAYLSPRRPEWNRTWWGAPVLGFLVVLAFLVVAQMLPGIACAATYAHQTGRPLRPQDVNQAILPALPWIIAFGLLVAPALARGLRALDMLPAPPAVTRPLSRGRFAMWVVVGAAGCLAGSVLVGSLLEFSGRAVRENLYVATLVGSDDWMALAAIVVAAPIAEELIFRRILFSVLLEGNGRLVAYLGTAVTFALMHGHLPAFANYCVVATSCAFVYEQTGSVRAAILVHALNNAAAITIARMSIGT